MHIPVLRDEIETFFSFKENTVYVDCTVGLGGHLLSFIERIATLKECVGIDMDTAHLQIVKAKLDIDTHSKVEVHLVHSRFENAKSVLENLNLKGKVTSILLDLGICSTHVDHAERGFSFNKSGPLDMRFDITSGLTAADIVNTFSEKDLTHILFEYGEEKRAKQIAALILMQRKQQPFSTTDDLSSLIAKHIPSFEKKHPATRTFQALRIAVNGELKQISHIMNDMYEILAPGGRVAVISYHSLEDRIVKQSLKEYAKSCICPLELPRCVCSRQPRMNILTKKPIEPSFHEIQQNNRSRSAKLRVAEKSLY
ncbi:MAG: 16S rRNA (cytosine(1402)-N(4))-methyltransferase RsmH [Candidatus Gracilibacteria bacterium]